MQLKTFLAVHLGIGMAIGAATAIAAQTHSVSQADLSFAVSELSAAPGDTIEFPNDDRTAHNILINDPAWRVNSGVLPPGEAFALAVPADLASGAYDVICAIHPRMKLTVNVQ